MTSPLTAAVEPGRRPPLHWLTWKPFLAFGATALAVRMVMPSGHAGQWLALAVSLLSVAAAWAGVLRLPDVDRRPPLVFAVGLTIYFVGDLFFYFFLLVRNVPRPYPSLAEVFYVTDLPVFITGLLLFVRRRNPGRDRASLIDAAIVATACGLVSWVYVIRPSVVSSSAPVLERVLGMYIFVFDVLLLTMAARLILAAGKRPVAHVLLFAGVACLTVADALYNFLNVLPSLALEIEPYFVLWMGWYVLVGAAMLHPSMASPGAAHAPSSEVDVDRGRLFVLGAVVLVAPAMLAVKTVTGNYGDVAVVVIASVLLFLLVMARMSGLMQKLRVARQEAEAANAAKSVFLAVMSHEIRTPLNAVIGLSDVLLHSSLDTEQRSCAETVVSSGQTLLGLINDILDFSKIESGAMELERERFDLGDCVESALTVVATAADAKGLSLAYRMGVDVPDTVVGDVTRLRQILFNLLSNAVKFTESGEVFLSVGLDVGAVGDDQRCVHFTVRDTGIGISPGDLDRIFTSFSQGEASTTRRYGGTGLGLAISRRLCELMGGTMWVESELGRGSSFHLAVPLKVVPGPLQPYRRPAQPQLIGRRLLVVDSDAGSREMVAHWARRWGMHPHPTSSTEDALIWLRRGDPFDAAIVDLPAASDVLSLIRTARPMPVVALTSLSGHSELAGSEFDGWLTRPIKTSQLFDSLMNVIAPGLWPSVSVSSAIAVPPTAGPALRVLVAEDNAVNQRVALLFLDKLGHNADVATNGLEVITALERRHYDVVLMDMHMPGMDGLDATRAIHRRWPPEDRPRIVAVTANAVSGDRESCLEAGMDDYVSKPMTLEELAEALGRCRR